MPITNIPTQEDYNRKATELIYDAFDELFNGNLEKSLASLHHSSELYLKSLICKESPYVLINIHKSGLSQTGNKDFSDFYSMDAVDLPKMVTFLYGEEILQNIYDKNFKEIYDKIRKIRNKYIHSSENIDYCEKELLLDLLIVFNTFNKEKDFLSYFSEGLGDLGKSTSGLRLEFHKLDINEKQEKIEEYRNKIFEYSDRIFEQCQIGENLNQMSKFIFDNLEAKDKKIFYKLPDSYRNNDKMYSCYKCINYTRYYSQRDHNKRSPECRYYKGKPLQFNSLVKLNENNFKCLTCSSEYILIEHKKCFCCAYHEGHDEHDDEDCEYKTEPFKTPFSKSSDGEFCLICGCNEEENDY